jgi:hypothetical protein
MSNVEKHIKQWKHNRRFAKTIDAQFRDWQINAIFYAALQLIDASLSKLGVDVSDHSSRNGHVKTNGAFAGVRQQYLDLYRISRITRYDADPDLWLPGQYLTVNDLVEDLLKPIENALGSLLGKTITFDPLHLHE